MTNPPNSDLEYVPPPKILTCLRCKKEKNWDEIDTIRGICIDCLKELKSEVTDPNDR